MKIGMDKGENKKIQVKGERRTEQWNGVVFANSPGDQDLIPGWVIPKTQKNGTWFCLA